MYVVVNEARFNEDGNAEYLNQNSVWLWQAIIFEGMFGLLICILALIKEIERKSCIIVGMNKEIRWCK